MKFENNGKDFVLPAEGPTLGICYLVCDLGTHERKYQNEDAYLARQMILAFELPSQPHPETGKPLIQYSRRFTVSLSEKSALRPFLEAWRGQKFSDTDIPKFCVRVLLGKGAMLQIGKVKDSKNKDRSQIMSIMGLPAGTKVAAPVNEALYFSTDEWDEEVFAKLPEWIQKTVKGTPEYAKHGEAGRFSGQDAGAGADTDDDIPF
jgi:hypothetical protein